MSHDARARRPGYSVPGSGRPTRDPSLNRRTCASVFGTIMIEQQRCVRIAKSEVFVRLERRVEERCAEPRERARA